MISNDSERTYGLPNIEQLEPRLLLSGVTFFVNSLADVVADDGVVTLREAIEAANENSAVTADVSAGSDTAVDVITFAPALSGGTITLGGLELEIFDNLDIQGLGEDFLTIDADELSRVFNIWGSETEVELAGLTITGGSTSGEGGGIRNNGTLTLTDSMVSGNSTTVSYGDGGGICNYGTLTLANSTVSGNSAEGDGGGIDNEGTLTLTNSTVSGNSAEDGGGIENYYDGTLTLTDSTVSDNSATESGGGIYNYRDGVVMLMDSTVSGNSAGHDGGGIYNSGTVTLTNSTVSDNSAASGGGIYNDAYDVVTLTNSTVSDNSAGELGGGIYNEDGGVTLTNSTVSGNSTEWGGGGIYNGTGTSTLTSSTVAGNWATEEGGGIYNYAGDLTLNNTIVALNDAGSGSDLSGPHASHHSLVSVDPGFARNPSPGADGEWGTADDSYGDLRLRATSPAIDAGDNSLLPADEYDLDGDDDTSEILPIDLAGSSRIKGGVVDIGAYEDQPALDVVMGDGVAKSVIYTDTDGTLVTVSLKGGTAVLTFDGDGLVAELVKKKIMITGLAELASIELHDTTAKSKLSFKTKKGDDGLAEIGEITGSTSLGKLSGKTVDLVGDGIVLTGNGTITSIQLHDLKGGADIIMPGTGAGKKGITIKAGQFGDGSDVIVGSYIKGLTVARWDDTDAGFDLVAPWVKSLAVKGQKGKKGLAAVVGDLQADMNLTSADPKKGFSLGKLKVAGAVDGAEIRAEGSMGSLMMGAAWDSDFLAGIEGGVDRHANVDADFANTNALIKSVKIKGIKKQGGTFFANSNFSAASIGKVSLRNADFDNEQELFGLFARDMGTGKEIKSVSYKDDSGLKWKWPSKKEQVSIAPDLIIRLI